MQIKQPKCSVPVSARPSPPFPTLGFCVFIRCQRYNPGRRVPMLLLNLLFIFAMAAPQQNSAAASATQQKLPTQTFQSDGQTARKLLASSQDNTCYTMRSYRFRQ
ncbi:MAG TPA: hypothetical protein VHA06_10895 [Candidatus Angelobacter sp.]|nr:hypothetical protein [Candidatus Angelobacter sp.]